MRRPHPARGHGAISYTCHRPCLSGTPTWHHRRRQRSPMKLSRQSPLAAASLHERPPPRGFSLAHLFLYVLFVPRASTAIAPRRQINGPAAVRARDARSPHTRRSLKSELSARIRTFSTGKEGKDGYGGGEGALFRALRCELILSPPRRESPLRRIVFRRGGIAKNDGVFGRVVRVEPARTRDPYYAGRPS